MSSSATTIRPITGSQLRYGTGEHTYPLSVWREAGMAAQQALRANPNDAGAQTTLESAKQVLRAHTRYVVAPMNEAANVRDDRSAREVPVNPALALATLFGHGASSGFAPELSGILASYRGGGLPDVVAGQAAMERAQDYTTTARDQMGAAGAAFDAAGNLAAAVAGGGALRRAAPAINGIFAGATAPAENFWGMFRHLPQKLAASLIGGAETGTVVGARAAGEADGTIGDRARAGGLGFAVGTALGTPVTYGMISAGILARTAAKGLAPIFQGWRGAAAGRAASQNVAAVAETNAAATGDAATRLAIASRLKVPLDHPSVDAVMAARRPVAATSSGPRTEAPPASAGDPADRIPGFIRRQSDTGPVPPTRVGEPQMPGQALHDTAGNPIPGSVVPPPMGLATPAEGMGAPYTQAVQSARRAAARLQAQFEAMGFPKSEARRMADDAARTSYTLRQAFEDMPVGPQP